MQDFWASDVWGFVNLTMVLLISLIAANTLKRFCKPIRRSLIPTSVLGGAILLIISMIYEAIAKTPMFDTPFFGGNGTATLEMITYHTLALGFIATTFKSPAKKMSKKETTEVFNTGVTTVSTYLLQGVLGLGITLMVSLFVSTIFPASGVILPFGYGQGTGQAMNYGNIYETEHGFVGGKSFGLTIAALGFISAAIGGVIYLNLIKKKRDVRRSDSEISQTIYEHEIQGIDEIPMNGSVDKMTIQLAAVFGAYGLAYLLMLGLGELLGGLKATVYGFNFLFGVLAATVIKWVLGKLRQGNVLKKQYLNEFLMNRIGGFFFDVMIVAGVAAIRLEMLADYWWLIIVLGLVGAFSTYYYNHFIAKKLFAEYADEQFLVMYGMLTGTASTGIILLRELDPDFKTPASDNLVYQNFPAIVFGFPMMLLATLAPVKPWLTFGILVLFFVAMNLILFRSFLFKRRKKAENNSAVAPEEENQST